MAMDATGGKWLRIDDIRGYWLIMNDIWMVVDGDR